MKYAIIIPDGCADDAQESLDGKTPLEAARLPAMDAVATAGVVGRTSNVPESLPAGSDVANLSLLGYNPLTHYTGRAPLEAAARGIELGADDWAVRCNLVTILDRKMRDFTAGHISTEEATSLLETAQEALGSEQLRFVPGVSYRNLLIFRATAGPAPFSSDTRTTPPHDLTDASVLEDYPRGPGSNLLSRLMSQTVGLFEDHPVNAARRAGGQLPATNVWLWGEGSRPRLAPFFDRFGKRGAMITAVDLLRGLAALLGWRRIDVPGATGYTDTDYAAKGRYAVNALDDFDLVCVHVEATDEASHEGDVAGKVEALESIDREIVGPVWDAIRRYPKHRILVLPDHATPLATRTHSHGLVPWTLAGTGIEPDAATRYDDRVAAGSSRVFEKGWELMPYFLGF